MRGQRESGTVIVKGARRSAKRRSWGFPVGAAMICAVVITALSACPTPNLPSGGNGSSGTTGQTVATPVLSPGPGTYPTDQQVTITDTTGGAVIYYTIDGSTPTAASTHYSSPITVSGTGTSETITAIAEASGMSNSKTTAATYTIAYPGAARWARAPNAPAGPSGLVGVVTDTAGNAYAVGGVGGSGSFDFGGNTSPFNGAYGNGNNAVMVKYDPSGVAQWVASINSASGVSVFLAAARDVSGNLYAVGYVNGTGSFGFGGSTSAFSGAYAASNAVLVKYNSSGVAQWVASIKSAAGASQFTAVAVDGAGNIYAAGSVYGKGQYDFGGNSAAFTGAAGDYNAVLVKYSSSGVAQWAASPGSASSYSMFNSLSVDLSGNAYAAGLVSGGGLFDFGGNSSPFSGSTNYSKALVVKYDSSGVAQWAAPISSATSDSDFDGIVVDSVGNLYAAGYVSGPGSFDFGGVSSAFSEANESSVLVKYNPSGSAQWAVPVYSATDYCEFDSDAIDAQGNIYAVGMINGNGSFNFGGVSTTISGPLAGASGAVIVKYNSSGIAQWATPIASESVSANSWSWFLGVSVDASSDLYATGAVSSGSYDFGGSSDPILGATVKGSAVIVKYNP